MLPDGALIDNLGFAIVETVQTLLTITSLHPVSLVISHRPALSELTSVSFKVAVSDRVVTIGDGEKNPPTESHLKPAAFTIALPSALITGAEFMLEIIPAISMMQSPPKHVNNGAL